MCGQRRQQHKPPASRRGEQQHRCEKGVGWPQHRCCGGREPKGQPNHSGCVVRRADKHREHYRVRRSAELSGKISALHAVAPRGLAFYQSHTDLVPIELAPNTILNRSNDLGVAAIRPQRFAVSLRNDDGPRRFERAAFGHTAVLDARSPARSGGSCWPTESHRVSSGRLQHLVSVDRLRSARRPRADDSFRFACNFTVDSRRGDGPSVATGAHQCLRCRCRRKRAPISIC
jgi:hypothetical protein